MYFVMEHFKAPWFVFFLCTTEAAVSAAQREEPGENDGINVSIITRNVCN